MDTIRFIDSRYKELFKIPDGGKIKINRIDGTSVEAKCKRIDDYHFYLNTHPESGYKPGYDTCLHICQFAEMMERNGSTYEPLTPLYELETVHADEAGLVYSDDKEQRGNIGYLRGDFDKDGMNFYCQWFDGSKELKTNEFREELDEVINYFRENNKNPILKDRNSMRTVCRKQDNLTVNEGRSHIFKTVTDKHTYYFKCTPHVGEYDFYVYCYENKQLQRYKDILYVEQNYDRIGADKFFKTANGFTELYYNPDSNAGGQIVQINFDEHIIKEAAKYKKPEDFFAHIEGAGRGYLIDVGTPEFRATFDDFKNIKGDFEGAVKKTMHGLMKAAGIKPPSKDIER